MFSVAAPDTQLFTISTSKATEKNLNYLKNKKFTRQKTLSVPEHILLKRIDQFVTAANVYLDTKK